ncbi:DNA adenine methylase [Mycoavidus sp. SF9855]|uniref:DNA adenine methylase n=1 Tax=Mycoavidus sp. SF9855 TaxID=2968475 RepID=UPI00211B96BF|nr:DNA adenine methylase [Mycoavidus sp. SF9855]UUM20951.1 DNA adenine methylase [Mycoavidus sp. SF9855]
MRDELMQRELNGERGINTPSRPVMTYHGGKWRLAEWIISHFPEHDTYVEPFGGAASVLMRKAPSKKEFYNDLDEKIVNVMRVLRDEEKRAKLTELLTLTPYSESEFRLASKPCNDPIECARRTLIRAEMGFGSAGATKKHTGFYIHINKKSSVTRVWERLPEGIQAFGLRLQGVVLQSKSALEVIRMHDMHDASSTLFYIDPPYMQDTRKMSCACYRHEMTKDDHVELLSAILKLKGMVILSGYAHELYDSKLANWRRVTKQVQACGHRGGTKRTEVLWLSPNIPSLPNNIWPLSA